MKLINSRVAKIYGMNGPKGKGMKKDLSEFARLLATAALGLLFAVQAYSASLLTYHHSDHLGSPIVTTNGVGEVISYDRYTPFGDRVVSTSSSQNQGNTVSYTGHTLDTGIDLTYAGARYYDHDIGRFYSNDPVGFVESNPLSFNRYAYANNSPYIYIDPDGEAAQLALSTVCGPATFACAVGATAITYFAGKSISNSINKSEVKEEYISSSTTSTVEKDNNSITLYRGVYYGHPDYSNALKGMAIPAGTNSSVVVA